MKYTPRPYQPPATQFIVDNKRCAPLLDMGLGKTVVVLTAVLELMDRCKIRGVLVLGPVRVIEDVWPVEVTHWDHTRKLKVSMVRGSETKRIKALETPADVYVTNYENLMWLAAYLAQCGEWPFDMVVYDESSKMKAHNTRRFKLWKVASEKFERAVILSGTPAPETYMNLWSQYYLVDGGQRLGKFFTHFQDRHFRKPYRSSFDWVLRDGSAKAIEDAVKDITLCLVSEDHVDLKPAIVNNIPVALPTKARKLYDEFHAEMIVDLDAGKLVALNQAMVSGKCGQLTSGAVYTKADRSKYEVVHDAKLDVLADIIEEMQGQPLLVLYWFRHEIDRLRKRWPKAPWIGGGSKGASRLVKEWNERKHKLLFAHPASIGHGVNLQHGGSTMCFVTTPWSGEIYTQTVKRLHRPGQTSQVIVHRLVATRTVDEVCIHKHAGKYKTQAAFLAAVKGAR